MIRDAAADTYRRAGCCDVNFVAAGVDLIRLEAYERVSGRRGTGGAVTVEKPFGRTSMAATFASIDDRYRDTPYYLAPEDKVGQEAFAVIRDAMKKKKMVGIARVVMARRERVMMLEAFGKGIMGTTLHYQYEIRSDEAVFEEIPEMKLPDQMLGLAEEIIDRMTGDFQPEKFEDRYENAMIELIRSKQAGLPAPKEKPATRPANVVNLMDALRRSIDAGGGKPKAPKPAGKRAAAAATRGDDGSGRPGLRRARSLRPARPQTHQRTGPAASCPGQGARRPRTPSGGAGDRTSE